MSMPDNRAPGSPSRQLIEYRCPVDGKTIFDEVPPECPECGTLMEPVADPYAARRRRLREGRKP